MHLKSIKNRICKVWAGEVMRKLTVLHQKYLPKLVYFIKTHNSINRVSSIYYTHNSGV